MNDFFIKINKDKIKTDKRVFLALLDLSPIQSLVSYKNALKNNEINFSDLKDLARRADIPYPLFFAPKEQVDFQIKDKEKSLMGKFPTKSEMQSGYRGTLKKGDIELIIKDISKRQEFLKNRIIRTGPDNSYIGYIAKKIKAGHSNKMIAQEFRDYFGIDLLQMRKLNKKSIVSYLCGKAEDKDIFVSLSSYNFMPQNIDKDLGMSGLCVKDKRFPFIFVNTGDGDEDPMILETEGRQIFTIISMLVCIGMNKFILNSGKGLLKKPEYKRMYALTGEILVPEEDVKGMDISSLDEIKELANIFKVTPSVVLFRLKEVGTIGSKEASKYFNLLQSEVKNKKNTPQHSPSLITGYSKYNGQRFSREIVKAYNSKKITSDEVKHMLFRKNKMDGTLLKSYLTKFE